MSGNNAFIKSMNGIVSFDSNGTTKEGDTITSGEIDCTTLNATDVIATGSLNTSFMYIDYIDKNVNTYSLKSNGQVIHSTCTKNCSTSTVQVP